MSKTPPPDMWGAPCRPSQCRATPGPPCASDSPARRPPIRDQGALRSTRTYTCRQVDASGKFGFVEFRDEPTAEVALHLFNGMALCGRPMHVARPQGTRPAAARPPAHMQPPPPRRAAPRSGPRSPRRSPLHVRSCSDSHTPHLRRPTRASDTGYVPPAGMDPGAASATPAAGPAAATTSAAQVVSSATALLQASHLFQSHRRATVTAASQSTLSTSNGNPRPRA